jgi:glycosyltransferase involved in cell wall biosynthesis
MRKEKLLFISNMAAPYQVKFCDHLNEYFDAKFWFYVYLESNRPKFWSIPLSENCEILKGSVYIKLFGYFNLGLLRKVKALNPDIILLGGLYFPGHLFVLWWAKLNKKKIVFISESTELKRSGGSNFTAFLKQVVRKFQLLFFRPMDLLFAMGEDVKNQFVNIYHFKEHKVKVTRYPQDIDMHLMHDLRTNKVGDELIILFPGRLEDMYNPLFAIELFKQLSFKYPKLKMKMNAHGSFRNDCEILISHFNLENKVSFLDNISNWNELHLVYKNSDILFIPAKYSNGPNTLIEGMASGMGVVISNHIFNIDEYLKNNENGFITNLDIQEMIHAFETYIQNPDLLAKHGEIGKENVRNRSAKGTAQLYFNLINQIN